MAKGSFNPNKNSFSVCLARLKRAAKASGIDQSKGIITSKDKAAIKAMGSLKVKNIPDGFTKWQLPVYMDGPSQMFVTVGAPGTKVPKHAHEEGDGIRFIAGGSILFEGKELSAGDWMFIPAGKKYSFEVGRYGAIMCYCYQCCCA